MNNDQNGKVNIPVNLLQSLDKDSLLACLEKATHVSLVVIDEDFMIDSHNQSFSDLLKTDQSLAGRSLHSLLQEESRQILTSSILNHKMPIRLHFSSGQTGCITLECVLSRIENGYLLFGEHVSLSDNDILQKMSTMNNELATLSRNVIRNNRELKRANTQQKNRNSFLQRSDNSQEEKSWTLNLTDWTLTSPKNTMVKLTANELNFLHLLASADEHTVSREEFLMKLYPRQDKYTSRALDAIVCRLRNKLKTADPENSPVQNSYGKGFVFSSPFRILK